MSAPEPTPSISVALCTHNGAAYIEEQLVSILEQQPAPKQLVVSDDASSDDTIARVRHTAARYPAVQLVVFENTPPLGVTKNFEQAIRACTGDLIALSDQDDAWHTGRLALFAAEFAAHPAVSLIHSDARLVDGGRAPLGHTLSGALGVSGGEVASIHSGDAFSVLLRRNLVTGACTVFRRSLVEFAAPFPPSWVHDEWLGIIAAAVASTDFIEQPTIDYRQHGANQIGATKLTLSGKFGRMMEPRRDRNARLETNMTVLVDRLQRLGTRVSDDKVNQAIAKLEHERMRNSLPEGRLRRIPLVARAFAAGQYGRYSRGPLDAVRDVLQPVD
ncbi:glycosyltransferase family 2 protein [Salinibacterium sp. NSLL150]|uniref:glycosyltransferase family 2 protein n=1 Tax=unclassified Salinibacterium TaxID=2632331 RepID=UPI0018CFDFE8|nr:MULTISPECIES: glycosyltransferase family 2 protein [unclassified Salinibacterium]MBH0098507.1 glycosyltransferase family 2 protein [Salinibacterium sp. NSLL35]MBH0101262.1 glycosyltransferase family 2 protein [Salinibacterium sp. NSLL150]MBH0104021.1 glycosyltransferase family 2 protein [Salinibacterium sp. NSLL16]MBH0106782.1 glycosyltransferase family 2 protein [Salinibacterium sp. NSLL17]